MGLITLKELGMSGLGQTGECGQRPGLGPGEKAMCCPGIGWVVYDQYESEYALCERAQAGAGTGAAGEDGGPVAADDLEGRRRAIDARRMAMEEKRFQQQVQMMLLQGQLRRSAQAQAAVAARGDRVRAREGAKDAARMRVVQEARRSEQTKKALTFGAIALAAAKVFALF